MPRLTPKQMKELKKEWDATPNLHERVHNIEIAIISIKETTKKIVEALDIISKRI